VSEPAPRDVTANTVNRLSIGFLLTWTLCTAISLAIDRWQLTVHSDVSRDERAYWTAYAFAFRPLNGVCLAFLLVVAKRLVLWQQRLQRAPGHWYMLSMALLLVIVQTEDVLRLAAPIASDEWLGSYSNYSLPMICANGLAIAAAFLGAFWIHGSVWWRLTLVSLAFQWSQAFLLYWKVTCMLTLSVGGFHIDALSASLDSFPAAVSLVAMYHDWRSARRHDFYHWLGICVLWAITLLSWPSLFWYAAIYG
jgi:hypothetical protein